MPLPIIVQKKSQQFAYPGSQPIGTLNFDSAVTAGNLLVAHVAQESGVATAAAGQAWKDLATVDPTGSITRIAA